MRVRVEVGVLSGTASMNTLQEGLVTRLSVLAEESLQRGEIAESERLYREALHFLELILEPDHVEIAKILYRLASVLEHQDKTLESCELISRARGIIRAAAHQTLQSETSASS